jgi:hypothetical protein
MIRNMVEDHVRTSFEALRSHFKDFCGCELCVEDVQVFALNRMPPRYVTSLDRASHHRARAGEAAASRRDRRRGDGSAPEDLAGAALQGARAAQRVRPPRSSCCSRSPMGPVL